jgi:hypothetical protein
MTDTYGSWVWTDVTGRTRQTLPKADTEPHLCSILTRALSCANAVVNKEFNGPVTINANTPVVGTYQTVADVMRLLFQTGSGEIVRLTVPAPLRSNFLADGITVDPAVTAVANLITACLAGLTDGNGNVVQSFLGGFYSRAQGTDLQTP